MELELQRIKPKSPGYPVLGNLLGNGLHLWTLEDPYILRPVSLLSENQSQFSWPYTQVKIPGVTAIQARRYRVYLSHSPRFGRTLPLVADVPGFTGIRIHRGGSAEHSEGCILIGKAVDPSLRFLESSKEAEESLFNFLSGAKDEIWLTIKNPV